MGTVGLNFGSATSGTGFDVATTVSSILAISSAIETPWKNRLTALAAQDTALTGIGTSLSTLSTAVSAFTNFDGILATKQGSSSDTNVLALTAASSQATAGSHTVTVSSLATTSSQYSNSINQGDSLSGSISLQVGSGQAQTVTVDSTNNTLAGLASTINSGSFGISASVITDTQGSRLSLVSKQSGAAGSITISSNLSDTTTSSAISFSVGQQGADAQLTVDGLSTTSASNTVTSAIPGVTFQLLSASTNSPVQVQIQNDTADIETAFQSLVTAYNGVTTSLSAQEGKDSSGNAQPLFGSPTVALIQEQLASSLLAGQASGAIHNISQLGLSLGPDGKLSLDANALSSALNNNFSDVVGYLQNANSFGQTLSHTLNTLGSDSVSGAVSLALQQNSTDEASLNSNIATEEGLLADQKTRLTTELTTANQILQSIPQQLDQQTQIYNAITGYKGG